MEGWVIRAHGPCVAGRWKFRPVYPQIAIILCLFVITSCASRTVTQIDRPAAAEAASLFRDGCYQCLARAFQLSVQSRPALAFEAATLLVARSKELGLPPESWTARAIELLPQIGEGYRIYLDVVTALPADPLSNDRDLVLTDSALRRPSPKQITTWRTAIAAGPGSPALQSYLNLSLTCDFDREGRQSAAAAIVGSGAAEPAVQYRAALCSVAGFETLESLRRDSPAFDEADYVLARLMLENPERADPDRALSLLTSASAKFPTSPSIKSRLAEQHQQREDWQEAWRGYQAVLELVTTHRDALLGKTVALSHLGSHAEAVTVATTLIDLGTWFLSDGYYWRAWNQYHLQNYAAARADVDKAKSLSASAAVLILSGLLEWRMGRPLAAEGELLHAVKVDGRACDAHFWLGHVRAESRSWRQSATAFSSAEACFDTDVSEWREALGKQQSNRVTINVPATTTIVTRLADAERRRAESSLNAAKSWLSGGQLKEAKVAITRALAHESTREEAQRLLAPKVPPALRHLQRG